MLYLVGIAQLRNETPGHAYYLLQSRHMSWVTA
jgi:hypothetical protein